MFLTSLKESQATMNDHFRDTVFGQAVRLLSRKRLLKFPDELDPALWQQCLHKNTTTVLSTSVEQDGLAGSKNHTAADVSDCGEKIVSGDMQALQQSSPSHEKTAGVCLVDWYGPDDPEV